MACTSIMYHFEAIALALSFFGNLVAWSKHSAGYVYVCAHGVFCSCIYHHSPLSVSYLGSYLYLDFEYISDDFLHSGTARPYLPRES